MSQNLRPISMEQRSTKILKWSKAEVYILDIFLFFVAIDTYIQFISIPPSIRGELPLSLCQENITIKIDKESSDGSSD